jgi:ribosomal protein S18 acetylase RimI-like enzyme
MTARVEPLSGSPPASATPAATGSPPRFTGPAGPVELRWHIDESAVEWILRAYAGQHVVGECQAWGVPAHLASLAGFREWTTIEWLGVEAPYRGQGLGRYLLQEQLRYQAARGIRHVLLWTEPDGAEALAARRLYESLGFVYGPALLRFQKPWTRAPSPPGPGRTDP